MNRCRCFLVHAGRPVCGRLVPVLGHPGVLGAEQLASASVAAELVQMPLLDLLAEDLQAAVADPDSDSWAELNTRPVRPTSRTSWVPREAVRRVSLALGWRR
jgi:hypothetical protein